MTGVQPQLLAASRGRIHADSEQKSAIAAEVHGDLVSLSAIANEWQALVDRSVGNGLFHTPAWNLAWLRWFGEGRNPYVVALRRERRLIAIAPLIEYRTSLRGLPVRVLGSYDNEHASRTGLIAEPGQELAAARALARHLAENARCWDVLLLRQLPADAAWVPAFIDACTSDGLTPFPTTAGSGKCVLPLPGSFTDYLGSKSRHFRARHKECLKRVSRHGSVTYRRSSGTPEDFHTFEQIETASWKSDSDLARLGARGWAFQKEVALSKDQNIRCHNVFLEIDGKVVGGIHAVGYGGVAYSLQMLFDESVRHLYPGRAQFSTHVREIFEDPAYRLLDLNGNSDFCKSWSRDELQFVDLQIYNGRAYSRLLASLKKRLGRNR